MKFIRRFLAWYYKVPWQKKEWYNAAACIHSSSWNEYNIILCFDESGSYIDCPDIGGIVIYSIKGVKYIYKIIGFKNSNRNSDWLYDTDYINPVIQFVKKA